jgi:PKD repeat protein
MKVAIAAMNRALKSSRRRSLLAFLYGPLLIAALSWASPAGASTYGGLGALGTKLNTGTEGKPGQLNPGGQAHGHAFTVDSETGQIFIADEFTSVVEGKRPQTFARLQSFNSKGEFVSENRVKFETREELPDERVGGLAVDPVSKRVYLMLSEERPEAKPKVEKELEKLEEKSLKTEQQIAKAKEKGEPTAALEKQLKEEEAEEAKLRAEEEVRDPGAFAAADIYSFSTESSGEKLKEQTLLTNSEVLNSSSEAAKAALLDPAGITVDPKTHDVIVLGQQDESPSPKEEDLRAAIERVHASGTLGPRYIDKVDCLDDGATVAGEPACKEDESEQPVSPVATAAGRIYVQDGEEVWEIPAPSSGEEGYKEVSITPKQLVALEGELVSGGVLKGTFPEEEGGSLAYVAGKAAGEGALYMRAVFPNSGDNGLVRFKYTESGTSGNPEAREVGWTGGQEAISGQQKCVVPGELNQLPLLATGKEEQTLLLSYGSGHVFAFGPGGETCGHQPTVTPPSVQLGSNAHATEVGVGQTVTLSSKLSGARATSVKWKFKYKSPQTGEVHEEPEVQGGYAIQTTTSLEHALEHEGAYEITETVETDNLAYPTVTAETTKVEAWNVKAALVVPESLSAGTPLTFKARVKDNVEATAHITATWNFGDGTPVVKEEKTGVSPVELTVAHTFAAKGSYNVTLELKDGSGGGATEKATLSIGESAAEREATKQREEAKRHEEEASRQHEQEANQKRLEAEAAQKKQQEAEAAQKKLQEEEAARKNVLGYKDTSKPEATIAGTSFKVSRSGALTLKVSCPAGATSCTGVLTLRTLSAVSASAHKAKKAILTLAGGSFSAAGGQAKTITLHLSSKARSLLAHAHVLRARATVVAHDTTMTSATTQSVITLRLAPVAHKH